MLQRASRVQPEGWAVDDVALDGEELLPDEPPMTHPGQDPIWDAGAEDWDYWHKKNEVFAGDGGNYLQPNGFGEVEFARAIEDEPLLDEDAVRLNAAGFDVGTTPFCFFGLAVGGLWWPNKLFLSL